MLHVENWEGLVSKITCVMYGIERTYGVRASQRSANLGQLALATGERQGRNYGK